jgi:hypothetical protein
VAVSPPRPPRGLIDTGAILAILDRDDRWHRPCLEALASIRLPLATSGAVLAELFDLIGDEPRALAAAWTFVRSGAVTLLGIDDRDVPELEALMKRYADRPMDFADATLVHLARRERVATVFTIDHDDFETYRIDGRRRFRVVPGRAVR